MPRRALLVALAGAAALPAPAAAALPASRPPDAAALRAAGLRVSWPLSGRAATALAPGATMRVRVGRIAPLRAGGRPRLPRRARVALVRVDARGRPMRIVARARLHAGTFIARLPARAGARYALRLRVGRRSWRSFVEARPGAPVAVAAPAPPTTGPIACPATGAGSGELRLEPARARAGEVVTATISNVGPTCLNGDLRFRWEARLPDGTWEPVEADYATEDMGWVLRPGDVTALSALVFPELQPGPHRLVKTVEAPDDELTLSATFEVLP